MESYTSEAAVSIQVLVKEMKQKLFSPQLQNSSESPSAYDTAWLAMIPDSNNTKNPMFKSCVQWVLNNQKEGGFWGDEDYLIHTLSSTLACILALATWNVGPKNIQLGKSYVVTNAKKLLDGNDRKLPRWFTIVFPAMLEQAERVDLHLNLPRELKALVSSFNVGREKIDDENEHTSLITLSCPEAHFSACNIDKLHLVKNFTEDGYIFKSPFASAAGYMATGHPALLKYLESVVQKFPCGVPSVYPVDEDLIKLCTLDKLINLGLAEYFAVEIEETLAQIYRSYNKNRAREQEDIHLALVNIYKGALAFRLLRFHGFDVTPGIFCWFFDHKNIMDHLEENSDYFASTLYNIYRASDLTFPGETELDDAKSFSRRLLERIVSVEYDRYGDNISQSFKQMIKKELTNPWIARVDHLDHRMWIENINAPLLCLEKPSFSRLSCLDDDILIQLSVQNYNFRQSIFRRELEELKSWSKQLGLADMGFGREKTTYCYFAVCGTMYSPHHSIIRKLVTKSAILITVADDFYDMEGSLTELQFLTEAVQRWDGEGLTGPSKIIFDALDHFVRDMAAEFLDHERNEMNNRIQTLWKETFVSWMMETTWGRTGYTPSADEYLDVGMTSIAAHTIALPASSCLLNQRMPAHEIVNYDNETITNLLMLNARLLNDIQSYEKEQEEGKNNLVLLHLKENLNADIQDSIKYVKEILNENRMEFLERVLGNDNSEMSKECKNLHLSCLKVFEMFFNSSNLFDSKTALLEDIEKAIYIPPRNPLLKRTIKPNGTSASMEFPKKKGFPKMNLSINWHGCRNMNRIGQKLSRPISSHGCRVIHIAPQLTTLGFF
ncbi:hypothetical protein DCAR_0831534 [Daucus carota subsp. sativus]|uniref:ent-kaurene synthase n=1 Tax=Daucus carota subsp. sativus TaxID=79200 RepID=A0A175YMI3_DAUCS|nr:PREDICTED: S-linalool synthase [Daucus carota subsp. sativus]WOH12037.1 hypothetical protein DCAR_0831534 [Daucus carota subsp. sativus]